LISAPEATPLDFRRSPGKLACLSSFEPADVTTPVRFLLPFSECKVSGGKRGVTLKSREHVLTDCLKPIKQKRLDALDAFRDAMNGGGGAQSVLGLSGRPFQEAFAVNRAFDTSCLMPVLERNGRSFSSVFQAPPLGAAQRRRLEREVYFICPLLGVLRPGDLVPDYRVPAGANLPGVGSLHKFWKGAISDALNRVLKGAHVFSFLPARLSALWEPDGRAAGITVMRFARLSDQRALGETAAVPRLSAESVRFILDTDARSVAEVMRFRSSAGHAYSAVHSGNQAGVRCLNFVCNGAKSVAAAR
jgi:uncharacterized protein